MVPAPYGLPAATKKHHTALQIFQLQTNLELKFEYEPKYHITRFLQSKAIEPIKMSKTLTKRELNY